MSSSPLESCLELTDGVVGFESLLPLQDGQQSRLNDGGGRNSGHRDISGLTKLLLCVATLSFNLV